MLPARLIRASGRPQQRTMLTTYQGFNQLVGAIESLVTILASAVGGYRGR